MNLIAIAFACLLVASAHARDIETRDEKAFSLFSVVSFKNVPCTSNSGKTGSGVFRNGTCYTTTECNDKGGMSKGNCASGFGVCCVFIISDTTKTIDQNSTYVQNPSYPSVYGSTSTVKYTINKCAPEVCDVRLDFETFTTLGPADTVETNGGACQDSFVVKGSSGLSSPSICGQNTGQHVYMEFGSANTDTATMEFTFNSASSTIRTWEVKVTQLPCNSIARPMPGCLQYHMGLTGRFTTFNFLDTSAQQHLANQKYSVCIRQEADHCCIKYLPCSDTNSYTLDNEGATNDVTVVDSLCTEDSLGISGVSMVCDNGPNAVFHSRICGEIFGAAYKSTIAALSVCDCSAPFTVDIVTDATDDGTAPTGTNPLNARGVCLNFKQVPCK